MKAKLLQMPEAKAAEVFSRNVPTVESNVSFTIQAVANENGSERLCVIDLPNPGPHGGLCRAYLTRENVDQLIMALNVWRVLQ